ncbi:MAG TPA: 50S ribosomal protein L3 [Longilinea sp.]|jgi:large subunit ribosomal protein L3|nr:50S ribosomal protein L3 [Longilinea sp.]
MFKGLIGKKIGMTQIFDETGLAIPVTLIEAGPCYVTQVCAPVKEGYSAVQLGFDEVKPKRLTGGELGHLKRNNLPPMRFLREFRAKDPQVQEGEKVDVNLFALGDRVDVVGTSKGKGFAGAVKRYHFKGGPKTHGQSDRHRAPGSRGSGTTPGRVYKGSRGPGHMGDDRVTAQNLRVVLVDSERNILGVSGSIPGARNGLVMIREARKA